jgi:hypothetical protein
MIAKFFRGGRTVSGAKSAVDYLLNERKEHGTAKVLEGDPKLTLEIIKGIKNKWKFTSGVLSFEELIEDERVKREIIEDFKRTFFAGLQEDEYNALFVEHTDKGRTEIHFLIPRTHLPTGKALNPYYVKRDFKKKDLWQDYINARYGLSSPHDLTRQNATKTHNPNWKIGSKQELQRQIDEFVANGIAEGLIQSRDDIIYLLEQNGAEVTRKGKNYISVKFEGMSKAIRLKGDYYAEDFKSVRELGKQLEKRAGEHIPATPRELEKVRNELNKILEKQAEYNGKRYTRGDQSPHTKDLQDGMDLRDSKPIDRSDNRSIGRDIMGEKGDRERKLDTEQKRVEIREKRARRNGMVPTRNTKRREIDDDRVRSEITKVVRAREARKRKREERANRYFKRAKRTHRAFDESIRAIEQAVERGAGNEIGRIVMNELEKFKTEINIAELAMLYGYELDKRKSSRNSKVLQHPENGDKVVVSRATNGHYIYFSVTDDRDNGTVIDFVQKRTGKNLGQVRKELRTYLRDGYKQVPKIAIKPSDHDTRKVLKVWERIDGIDENKARLVNWRGIDIWDKAVAKGRVKIGKDGAIYFPMYNTDGLCGIEKRDTNSGEKRVIQCSKKGLWTYSPDIGNIKNADLIVVTESPLDALSWYKLNKGSLADKSVYLIATMGALSEEQKLSLREIARATKADWILATDNDKAGERLAGTIRRELISANRRTEIYRHTPENAKDWNERLVSLQRRKRNTRQLSL